MQIQTRDNQLDALIMRLPLFIILAMGLITQAVWVVNVALGFTWLVTLISIGMAWVCVDVPEVKALPWFWPTSDIALRHWEYFYKITFLTMCFAGGWFITGLAVFLNYLVIESRRNYFANKQPTTPTDSGSKVVPIKKQ